MLDFSSSPTERLNLVIDLAWRLFFERIAEGRIKINKEASMQLHYASILKTVGELYCTLPQETFTLELESAYGGKNLDITCTLGSTSAALELKCFRKASNRALDLDMYDVWTDIKRLSELEAFQIRRFICLTDNHKYPHGPHGGYSATFSIAEGTSYSQGTELAPPWAGKWANTSRDHVIPVHKDITFLWTHKNGWYYLLLEV